MLFSIAKSNGLIRIFQQNQNQNLQLMINSQLENNILLVEYIFLKHGEIILEQKWREYIMDEYKLSILDVDMILSKAYFIRFIKISLQNDVINIPRFEIPIGIRLGYI